MDKHSTQKWRGASGVECGFQYMRLCCAASGHLSLRLEHGSQGLGESNGCRPSGRSLSLANYSTFCDMCLNYAVSGSLLECVMPDVVEPQETTGSTLLSHLQSFYISSNKGSFSESVIPSQIKVTGEEFFLKGASNQAFGHLKISSYKSPVLQYIHTHKHFSFKKKSHFQAKINQSWQIRTLL